MKKATRFEEQGSHRLAHNALLLPNQRNTDYPLRPELRA